MDFPKKTVRDIDLRDKRVLLRVDYNVTLGSDGQILSDYRIQQSLPTIRYLLEQNCKIIIMSHLGRPDGRPDKTASLRPTAVRLSELLDQPVALADDCVGSDIAEQVQKLQPRQVLMLENVRFHAEEEKNDDAFAKELASYGDVFVQDCFGVAHRSHASIVGVTKFLPSVAGLLLEKEVTVISNVMKSPDRPLMAIVGGAKISDKIEILKKLIDIADFVAIGGAMANTFLLAQGIKVGKSLVDVDDVPMAREILELAKAKSTEKKFIFYVPQDGVVAKKIDKSTSTRIVDWSAHVIASIENYPKTPNRQSSEIADDEMILDIGPYSGSFIAGGMQLAQTVIWNGTMGVAEIKGLQGPVGPYAHGTEIVIDAMSGHFGSKPFSVVGGGDTAGYLESRGLNGGFNHVSTGGGASLDLMAGKELPGVTALMDKDA